MEVNYRISPLFSLEWPVPSTLWRTQSDTVARLSTPSRGLPLYSSRLEKAREQAERRESEAPFACIYPL